VLKKEKKKKSTALEERTSQWSIGGRRQKTLSKTEK